MDRGFHPIIVNAPQRSEEWYRRRLGNVTGSKIKLVMEYAKPTVAQMKLADEIYEGNAIDEQYVIEMREKYPIQYCRQVGIEIAESAGRMTYRENIVAERITGIPMDQDMFITREMKWGQIMEGKAANAFAEMYPVQLQDAPLMLHPNLLCGASPDRFAINKETGELANVEIKNLASHNHLYKIVLPKKMPDEHFPQVMMQMWLDGYDMTYFVGYDMRVQRGLELMVVEVAYDPFYIDNVLLPNLTEFLEECDFDERRFYAIKNAELDRRREKLEYEKGLMEAALK